VGIFLTSSTCLFTRQTSRREGLGIRKKNGRTEWTGPAQVMNERVGLCQERNRMKGHFRRLQVGGPENRDTKKS